MPVLNTWLHNIVPTEWDLKKKFFLNLVQSKLYAQVILSFVLYFWKHKQQSRHKTLETKIAPKASEVTINLT